MKEQGRQYQITVFTNKGTLNRNFKSKPKGEAWAKEQKGYINHRVDIVK